METLGNIFGSLPRVKIMRLFLFNPGTVYDSKAVIDKARINKKEARKELQALEQGRLIKGQTYITQATATARKKKGTGWMLDDSFPFLKQLQALLIHTIVLRDDEIVERVSKLGRIKLVVVAGVFIQHWDSRLDVLVVGDKLREGHISGVIKKMEAEIGRELHYSVLDVQDFQYRVSVGDKLVRDVFDYSHRILLDKLGVSLRKAQ